MSVNDEPNEGMKIQLRNETQRNIFARRKFDLANWQDSALKRFNSAFFLRRNFEEVSDWVAVLRRQFAFDTYGYILFRQHIGKNNENAAEIWHRKSKLSLKTAKFRVFGANFRWENSVCISKLLYCSLDLIRFFQVPLKNGSLAMIWTDFRSLKIENQESFDLKNILDTWQDRKFRLVSPLRSVYVTFWLYCCTIRYIICLSFSGPFIHEAKKFRRLQQTALFRALLSTRLASMILIVHFPTATVGKCTIS